jgi:hypothetical protein
MYTLLPNSLDISINCGLYDSLILKPFTHQYHEDGLAEEYPKEM